jgi:hypothetical protein
VDDTFTIWPHGPDKLKDFLNHLNSIHECIQFTMETESEGHLPFLDIDIYRRPDGSLGHRVYRKATHTNLYLNAGSHHHPSSKQAVLFTLVHRVRALCDEESLQAELAFLQDVFKQNGYNDQQIHRVLNRRPNISQPEDKPDSVPCECGKVYIGQTGRSVDTRLKEHQLRHPLLPALNLHQTQHIFLSAYFLCGHTLSLPFSYTAGCTN